MDFLTGDGELPFGVIDLFKDRDFLGRFSGDDEVRDEVDGETLRFSIDFDLVFEFSRLRFFDSDLGLCFSGDVLYRLDEELEEDKDLRRREVERLRNE